MATANNQFDQIDHIVVLMLENRSYDCLLGYLSETHTPTHFIPPDNQSPLDDVAGKDLWNLVDPNQPESPSNPKVCVAKAPWQSQLDMTNPSPDPGETYSPHILRQLFGTKDPSGFPLPAPMSGFLADYKKSIASNEGWFDKKDPTLDEYKIIMNCFPPEALPVLSGLARDFAVSDAWHCSVPSQTFCNRSFFNSASSHGFVTNSDYVKWLDNSQDTIFNLLPEADWRVYWDMQDVIGSLTRLIHPPLNDKKYAANFRTYGHRYGKPIPPEDDQFRKDCVAGDLPKYTFIEPRLFLDHNDMHPPVSINPGIDSSILAGEILVNKIYEDLYIYGANSDRTLLIITFDEHGGTYDHVSPRKATPPEIKPSYPLQDHFGFDLFGVRVPAILVSPWIKQGTVFRSSTDVPLDHTSVIRTIINKWLSIPDFLTDRDKAAPDIADVVNGTEARARVDLPRYTPREYEPIPEPHLHESILSDLQRAALELFTAVLRKQAPENMTIMEALRFIEELKEDL